MEVRFTQAARKHRIGRASVRHVLANSDPTGVTTGQGNPGWHYVGPDDRNRELEIIAVEIEGSPEHVLLVIHVMPTRLRGRGTHA